MYHFKSNANQIVNKCCQNDGVHDSHYIVCDSYVNNRKDGFITNLQILITKLGLIICEATVEEDKVSYYREAIKYLCVDVLGDKNLYKRFIQLQINELGNKGKHTIEELNRIDMNACVNAFNDLINIFVNKHSLTSLKTILINKNIPNTSNTSNTPQVVKPKAYLGNKPFWFVSYSHADSDKVYPLIEELQKRNINVWFDEGILYGGDWKKNIIEKINNCSFFVFVASSLSLKSKNCEDEFEFAVGKRNKKWISIFLEKTNYPDWYDFSYSKFQGVNAYDFSSPREVIDDLFLKCPQLKSFTQNNGPTNTNQPETNKNTNQNQPNNQPFTNNKPIKKYKCPYCNRDDFKNETALNSHINDKHKTNTQQKNQNTNTQPSPNTKKVVKKQPKTINNVPKVKDYECLYCKKSFGDGQALRSHMRDKHPNMQFFLWPIISGAITIIGVALCLILIPFFKELLHPFFSILIAIGAGSAVFLLIYSLVVKSYIFTIFKLFIKGYFTLIKNTYDWEIDDARWILVPLKILLIGLEFIFYAVVILFTVVLCALLSIVSFPFVLYRFAIKRY